MKTTPLLVSASLLLAACGTTPAPVLGKDYWRHQAGAQISFETDNRNCVSRASRVGPPSGLVVPANRIDRPVQKWNNAEVDRAYMECMRSLGWSPVTG